jgi:antitoxin MazE
MKAKIVRVGNSLGIRIPRPLLEQTGLEGEVEIEARGDRLIVRPTSRPRAGWAEAFRNMAEHGDDAMLFEIPPSEWDKTDWQWR